MVPPPPSVPSQYHDRKSRPWELSLCLPQEGSFFMPWSKMEDTHYYRYCLCFTTSETKDIRGEVCCLRLEAGWANNQILNQTERPNHGTIPLKQCIINTAFSYYYSFPFTKCSHVQVCELAIISLKQWASEV